MNREIALVLSGGGARGISHIGAIEVLLERGFTITSVAGTSMGALVGGMLAKGNLEGFTAWLKHITRRDILKLLDISIGKGGFLKGERILHELEQMVGEVLIEDLEMPYSCVAVDLHTHKEVIYRRGSLLKAIRASISIPTVFLPIVSDESIIVDGGLLNPLPLSVIKRKNGEMLVAVDVNAPTDYDRPEGHQEDTIRAGRYKQALEMINHRWSELVGHSGENHHEKQRHIGLFEIITESIAVMQEELTKHAVSQYNPDLFIQVSRKTGSIFDFYKAEEMIEAGRQACLHALRENGIS